MIIKAFLTATLTFLSFLLVFFCVVGGDSKCFLAEHKTNSDWFCRVCDHKENLVLMEHFNRDTNQIQLSIVQNGKLLWIKHPYGVVPNLNNSVSKNNIIFGPNRDKLLVNNCVFPIEITSETCKN